MHVFIHCTVYTYAYYTHTHTDIGSPFRPICPTCCMNCEWYRQKWLLLSFLFIGTRSLCTERRGGLHVHISYRQTVLLLAAEESCCTLLTDWLVFISLQSLSFPSCLCPPWNGSRFLRRLRSNLTRSLLYLKNELGPTYNVLRAGFCFIPDLYRPDCFNLRHKSLCIKGVQL